MNRIRVSAYLLLAYCSATLHVGAQTASQRTGNFTLTVSAAPVAEQSPAGESFHTVRLQLETTAEGVNVLVVNPDRIKVLDVAGKAYPAVAVGISKESKPNYVATAAIRSEDGQIAFDVRGHRQMNLAIAKVKGVPNWTLTVEGKDSDTLCMLFKTSEKTTLKELRWPGLQPFALPTK